MVVFVGVLLEKLVVFRASSFFQLRWKSVDVLERAPRYALRDGAEWVLREL